MTDPNGALATQRRGDIAYFNGAQWAPVADGSELRSLIIQNGVPTYIDPSVVRSELYNFSMKVKGYPVTLTGGVAATVTLGPVPVGVNGTNTNHYLYISGGTGTAEAVLITGGNAISGRPIGTITFTPANNHSGNWTISSATAGIQEAMWSTGTEVHVQVPAGQVHCYATVTIPLAGGGISGHGSNISVLMFHNLTQDFFITTNNTQSFFFRDLAIIPGSTTGAAGGGQTAGAAIHNIFGTWISLYSVNLGYVGYFGVYIGVLAAGGILDIRNCQIICNYQAIHGTIYPQINGLQVIGNRGFTDTPPVGSAGIYLFETAGGFISNYLQANGPLEYGLYIDTAGGYCNEVSVTNFYADFWTIGGIYVNGSGPCAHWELSNFRLNDDSSVIGSSPGLGIVLQTGVINWEISNGNIGSDNAGLAIIGCTNVSVSNVRIFPASATGAAGGTGYEVFDGDHISFVGCSYGNIDILTANGAGLIIQAGTTDYLTVVGCTFQVTTQASKLAFIGTVTHAKIANNSGISNFAKSAASAIAFTFPMMDDQDMLTITGTAAATSVSGLREGQIGILIFTNALPGIWTAGATIGNTFTPTQNVPVKFAFTGGKIYLSD